jgi:hypothetical protein
LVNVIALVRGDVDQAYDLIDSAEAYAKEHEMRFFWPFTNMIKGMFYGTTNQPDKALEHYAAAEEQAQAMGMLPVLWQVQAASAGIHAAEGRIEHADERREHARKTIDQIAAGISDAELRSQFVGNATQKL